jgi:hypothetical protein
MPICPVFKQIGERFGGFDLAVSLANMNHAMYVLNRDFFVSSSSLSGLSPHDLHFHLSMPPQTML